MSGFDPCSHGQSPRQERPAADRPVWAPACPPSGEVEALLDELHARSPAAWSALVAWFRSVGDLADRNLPARVEQHARIVEARRLLDLREPRTVVRDRLVMRFQCSRRTAYRAIDAALQRPLQSVPRPPA